MTFLVVAVVLSALQVPSPYLLAGVAAGAAAAMTLAGDLSLPRPLHRLALGLVGVGAGSMIDSAVVDVIAGAPFLIFGSVAATLVISLVVGQLLRMSDNVSQTTATFASIAGGASAVTAVARELHADEAVVVSVQYLRVLIIIMTVPLLAPLLGGDQSPAAPAVDGPGWDGLPFTLVALGAGLGLAQFLRFTASHLMLPMIASIGLSVSSAFDSNTMPVELMNAGLAGIGLMVGLALTRESLRRASKVLPLALATYVLGIGGAAVIGVVFAEMAGVSMYTGYLATTPGGLSAVIAFAVEGGADVGLVVTCQALRLVMALLLSVAFGVIIRRRRGGTPAPESS